ncbi:MAG: TetR/AcrR family transcriptional regulator [Phyllobacteriaceae bacterium]|nr:TetR/AcrR family transcriptional regulator [Phyllobacteriaceae bacterium]
MSDVPSSKSARKPRADAARNRRRLIEVAREVFAAEGSAATLEEIARVAGVGIGTLYRHFPTRDDLVAAVYRETSRQLAEAADRLSREVEPIEALRRWLLLFVDHMATKMRMAEALDAIFCASPSVQTDAAAEVSTAIDGLVARAAAAGVIAADVEPLDLLRSIAGIAYMSPRPDWRPAADRFVDVLIAGLARGGA